METNYIKMGITSLLALVLTVVLMTSTGIIDLKLGSSFSFNSNEPDFRKSMQQNSLINTLKKSLPAYYEQVISDPELDKEQIESLKLMYLPVINEFIKTGNIALIDKSNSIKNLIVNGELRAKLTRE